MSSMDYSVIEETYPLDFREKDARTLGEQLAHKHSVNLIGMKRVGISNFLRFFLYHKEIVSTHISKEERFLFIPVDLNDLVEREIYPFWSLTLKRIVDVVNLSELPGVNKKRIETLFSNSIQSQDLFLLTDSVRQAITEAMAGGAFVVLFFLRFDRMRDAITQQFFDNLQGLKDATHQRLSYVFTGFRGLDQLAPTVFTKHSLSVFSNTMYMKPAEEKDSKTIYETYRQRYTLSLTPQIESALFEFVDGYVQYLQLALILLHEKREKQVSTKDELFELLIRDERFHFQSEELWESLTRDEKDVIQRVAKGENILPEEKAKAVYLWETGFVHDAGEKPTIFSPVFAHYLRTRDEKAMMANTTVHFSKKEHLLITYLQEHKDQICEREQIVEAVWPEYKDLGVSDWAIDRLVARVRVKLKQQQSEEEIITVRTRGYKLITSQI